MKALIWIIVLILVVWGIWWWANRGPADNTQPAAAVEGLDSSDSNGASSTSAPQDDSTMIEEKG